ncbi:hypothetical protein HPB48_019323 [Haemaphysalis longicornis]|uniref:Uncharacterized protein n=1 Tax=Haemaphysalis longicornis TaxID=44386 RepID=A0A9J6GT11_HAELO|nr:hypothetical protein HPB48_019323 [Haemaphysalis longicornis]
MSELCAYHRIPTEDPDDGKDTLYFAMEDLMGMTITSGSVVIQKDDSNLIGISIGGGPPSAPASMSSRQGSVQEAREGQ